jgi:hypothetical protein
VEKKLSVLLEHFSDFFLDKSGRFSIEDDAPSSHIKHTIVYIHDKICNDRCGYSETTKIEAACNGVRFIFIG